MSEAVGKVLGMALAYAISALGLLLAYYNYRKRIVKAEKVFTGTAWGVIAAVIIFAAAATALIVTHAQAGKSAAKPETPGAVANPETADGAPNLPVTSPGNTAALAAGNTIAERLKARPAGSMVPGIVIPIIIFAFSFWVTWALYKHFAKKLGVEKPHES